MRAPRTYADWMALTMPKPIHRALFYGTLSFLIGKAFCVPSYFFYDGKLRPFKPLCPDDEEAVDEHFILIPLTVATLAYFVT